MKRIAIIFMAIFLPFLIIAQTADFDIQAAGDLFCAPASVKFSEKCSGNPIGFIWNIGADKSYDESPLVNFSKAGVYAIKLTAVYNNGSATITKQVTIHPAVDLSLKADRTFICQAGAMGFNVGANVPIANYSWNFGDSTPELSSTLERITHDFNEDGTYKVLVTATSNEGCSASKSTSLKLQQPLINAGLSISTHCIPAKVKFTAKVSVPSNSTVKSYAWDFGDGSSTTTNTGTVENVYSATGSFKPVLTVTTSEGCVNRYLYDTASFGTPPIAMQYGVNLNNVCASEMLSFHSNAASANQYKWTFGDGNSLSTGDTLLEYQYRELGAMKVSVISYYNGCKGDSALLDVMIGGVVAAYDYANTCLDKKTYSFKNNSLGSITNYNWDFGTGDFNNSVFDPTRTYPESGVYKTLLTVEDTVSGCIDTIAKNIYTANPSLINPDEFVCRYDSTFFQLRNNYQNPDAAYSWSVVGKKMEKTSQTSLAVKTDSLGFFRNYVIVDYGKESCPDTIHADQKMTIRGPIAAVDAPANICFSSPIIISNQTHSYLASDAISSYSWRFTDSSVNTHAFEPQPYYAKRSGSYKVVLKVKDVNGCIDSVVHNYRVDRKPFVKIIDNHSQICFGDMDTIMAFHSDSLRWSFANSISCNNCDTIFTKPANSGWIYATASNRNNCSATDSIYLKVFKPFNAKVAGEDYTICAGQSVNLLAGPSGYKVVWSPSTGISNPTISNPVAIPIIPTVYTATLSDSANCFSSTASIKVNVSTPASVNAGADTVYPFNASFTLKPSYSSNIKKYQWSPAENLNCTGCAFPKGMAKSSELYYIDVVSDSGCVARDSIQISIQCDPNNLYMPTAFSPNHDNLNDVYYPLLRGVRRVLRFAIYNRFGQLMYEAKNFPPNKPQFGWDGSFHGQLQASTTYVYVLDVICDLGDELHKNGSFVLIR